MTARSSVEEEATSLVSETAAMIDLGSGEVVKASHPSSVEEETKVVEKMAEEKMVEEKMAEVSFWKESRMEVGNLSLVIPWKVWVAKKKKRSLMVVMMKVVKVKNPVMEN